MNEQLHKLKLIIVTFAEAKIYFFDNTHQVPVH